MSVSDDLVLYNVARYIESLKGKSLSLINEEKLNQLIEVFNNLIPDNSESFQAYSYHPTTIPEIFSAGIEQLQVKSTSENVALVETDPRYEQFVQMVTEKGFFEGCEEGSLEYLQRQSKLVYKYNQKKQTSGPTKEENEAAAEEKKVLGNAAMSAKDYETAIQYYTEALDLSSDGPNSHIYYSNRAAAYCYTNQHELSVLDCEAAIDLKEDYAKAHARLGFSNFHLGRYDDAVIAYERVVELEPTNKEHQEALRKAKKKAEKSGSGSSSSSLAANTGGMGGAGGMPDLSALSSMMGGGGGLDSMLNNPRMKESLDKMGGV